MFTKNPPILFGAIVGKGGADLDWLVGARWRLYCSSHSWQPYGSMIELQRMQIMDCNGHDYEYGR